MKRIQEGDKAAELQLWEQVKRFARMKASRLVYAGKRAGTEMDDFMQAAFLAMLDAVKYCDVDLGFKFLTIYNFYLNNYFRKLTGLISNTRRINPVYLAKSLDEPLGGEADEDYTLEDLLRDENAIDPEEAATGLGAVLREALNTLPEEQRAAVEGFYYHGVTTDSKLRQKGLRALRHPTLSSELKDFL